MSDIELAQLEKQEAITHARFLRVNRMIADRSVVKAAEDQWHDAVDAVRAYRREHDIT